jgi:SAM-dependent methyltransferase
VSVPDADEPLGSAAPTARPTRSGSYGQHRDLSPIDRLGVWLSARAVRRHVDPGGARVADVGCGHQATLARSMLGAVQSMLLVDLAVAPQLHADPRVEIIEGRLPDALAGVASASQDLTLCLSVLEHLWEPQAMLDELRRITAPGGTVIVNVPTWLGKRALELSAFRLGLSPAEEMDDHKRYYDPRDLWPMLVRAGFAPSGISCRRHKAGLNTIAVCRTPGPRWGEP